MERMFNPILILRERESEVKAMLAAKLTEENKYLQSIFHLMGKLPTWEIKRRLSIRMGNNLEMLSKIESFLMRAA